MLTFCTTNTRNRSYFKQVCFFRNVSKTWAFESVTWKSCYPSAIQRTNVETKKLSLQNDREIPSPNILSIKTKICRESMYPKEQNILEQNKFRAKNLRAKNLGSYTNMLRFLKINPICNSVAAVPIYCYCKNCEKKNFVNFSTP